MKSICETKRVNYLFECGAVLPLWGKEKAPFYECFRIFGSPATHLPYGEKMRLLRNTNAKASGRSFVIVKVAG